MENLERLLAEHPFLAGLPKDHLELLVGCAANVKFNAKQYLFREGEEAEQFFIIRSGKVALELYVPGEGAITIQTLGEGEIIGWSWLFPPYRWRFDAQAMEQTLVIALDGKCLRNKCEGDHHLGYQLLKRFTDILEQRLQAMRMQLLDVYKNT